MISKQFFGGIFTCRFNQPSTLKDVPSKRIMGFGETSTVSAHGGKIKQRSSKKRSFLVEFNFVRLLDAYIYQSSFLLSKLLLEQIVYSFFRQLCILMTKL